MKDTYKRIMAALAVGLMTCVLMSCSPQARSQGITVTSGAVPQVGHNDNNDSAQAQEAATYDVHTGVYKNAAFFYSVRIPNDLQGLSSPPPMPQHGVIINLDTSREAILSIQGYYNAVLWKSLSDAFNDEVGDIKKDNPQTEVITREAFTLGGYPAIHFVVRYVDRKTNEVRRYESVMAFRKRPDETAEIIYEIRLETTEDRYSQDTKVFEDVVQSWKML